MTTRKILSFKDFKEAFQKDGFISVFSEEALKALFEHLHDENGNDQFDIDVIRLAHDFTEYENLSDITDTHPEIEDLHSLDENAYFWVMLPNRHILVQEF